MGGRVVRGGAGERLAAVPGTGGAGGARGVGMLLGLALLMALGGALPGPSPEARETVVWSAQPPASLPLISLAQGDARSGRPPAPALIVVASAAELERLAGWLADPALLARLQALDYTTTLVVAAVVGPRPSSGYALAIQTALLDGDTVRLVATETAPAPEQRVLDVISYPYHLVAIPRAALPAGSLRWQLVDTAGQILATTCGPTDGP